MRNLRIGAGNGGAFFEGVIDEVAIYEHVLADPRISMHYAAGIGALP